jgi:hypothetical protein
MRRFLFPWARHVPFIKDKEDNFNIKIIISILSVAFGIQSCKKQGEWKN